VHGLEVRVVLKVGRAGELSSLRGCGPPGRPEPSIHHNASSIQPFAAPRLAPARLDHDVDDAQRIDDELLDLD
jgi:hypothetical protein